MSTGGYDFPRRDIHGETQTKIINVVTRRGAQISNNQTRNFAHSPAFSSLRSATRNGSSATA